MTNAENKDYVLTELHGGVLVLRLNRPEKRNALNQAMYNALGDAFRQADSDDAVRVVLLTGTRDCFSAGNDIKDFQNASEQAQGPSAGNTFGGALRDLRKPVIAAVGGLAIGIGVTMLLHCDLVYCGRNARFRLPFVNLGLVPEFGSSMIIPMMAGYHKAAELLLLGEVFGPDKAREAGLVNDIFTDDQLMDKTMAIAARLAAQPPSAIRLTKALMKQATAKAIAEFMVEEGATFRQRLLSPEAREAFRAFFEKREPDFSSFK